MNSVALTPALCLEIGRFGLLNVALHSGTGFNFYTARKSYAFDLACLHFDLTFSQLETESLQPLYSLFID